jgi:hypothetical protein
MWERERERERDVVRNSVGKYLRTNKSLCRWDHEFVEISIESLKIEHACASADGVREYVHIGRENILSNREVVEEKVK